jgi:hypothetical protein
VQCWLLILKGDGFLKPSLRRENKLDGREFCAAADFSEGYTSVKPSLIVPFGRTAQSQAYIHPFFLPFFLLLTRDAVKNVKKKVKLSV